MSLGRDFMLDDDGDLLIEGRDLVLRADVAQAVRTRLRMIRGEWFEDANQGLNWRGDGDQKLVSMAVLLAEIREKIVSTPGVGTITKWSYRFVARRFELTWSATTDAGEVGSTETF